MPYHISSKGTLTPCKAQPGKCPLGGKHFVTETGGMAYLDNLNHKEQLIEDYKAATTPFERRKIGHELQSVNEDLGLHPLADIPKLKTNANEEVYNELTNKYIPDMKKFAEKINTEFVDFKVNNRGEVVIKVLDDNKPRNITFYRPLGGHPFIKVGGEHAYYQCKNPLKKWHSAEQDIELILAKLK